MGDNNNNDNNKYNKEGSSDNIVNILSHTWVTIYWEHKCFENEITL